jgi:hypothetical protein
MFASLFEYDFVGRRFAVTRERISPDQGQGEARNAPAQRSGKLRLFLDDVHE